MKFATDWLKDHLKTNKTETQIVEKLNNTGLEVEKVEPIKNELQNLGMGRVILENSGNIGKNYRRHDEIGTPICITVDFETLDDDSVTVRDRDTMEQKRIAVKEIPNFFEESLL